MNCDNCQLCKKQNAQKPSARSTVPPPINTLFLGLTEDCNSRCRYCFVHQNPSQMPYEIAFEGVNWLSAQTKDQHLSVNFFGGEPLLRWNDVIVPITLYAKQKFGNRISLGMTTNALLMDEAKLQFMRKHGIGMLLSFDGCKECQDYNRPLPTGKSSFDVVAPKIPLILKHFPKITMRMTLHKPTVHTFYENHRFAVEAGFQNTFVAINTFDEWTDEDFGVLEEQMYKVADLYIQLTKNGKNISFNPLIRQYSKINGIRNEKTRTSRAYNFGYGKCGIGANGSVVLSTNGDLFTCQETYTNGNIRDFFHVGDIKNGIDNARRLEIVNTYNPEKLRRADGASCDGCKINKVCDGGCLVRNYTHNKDFNIVPVCVCRYENLMYDVFLYIEKQLENNALFQSTVLNSKR